MAAGISPSVSFSSSKTPGEQQQCLRKQSPSSCLVLLRPLRVHIVPSVLPPWAQPHRVLGAQNQGPVFSRRFCSSSTLMGCQLGPKEYFGGHHPPPDTTKQSNKSLSRQLLPCNGRALPSISATPLPASLPRWVPDPGPAAVTGHDGASSPLPMSLQHPGVTA